MDKTKDLTIIGGGITGLATAYIAAKAGRKVRVLEASPKLGGLLNTFEIQGSRLEFYYHHFFTHDAELNWLIKDLGIQNKLIFKETSMGVFRNNKIFNFNGPADLLKFSPIGFFDKMRFAFSSLYLGKFADWKKFEGVPAIKWLRKWAGKGTTKSLWEPLLNIKFGPYAEVVPLSWLVGRLRQRMNSRKGGDERLGYLEGSLQTLLDSLVSKLEEMGVELHVATPVESVVIDNSQIKSVKTPNQEFVDSQYIFTIPTPIISKLFKEHDKNYSNDLDRVEYFGAICTILEMDKSLSDIYWLNVADDDYPFGGVIEQTNFIGPEHYKGKHIAYLSRYFAHSEDIAKMNKDEVRTEMLKGVERMFPAFKAEDVTDVHIFRTDFAATVCDLNFSDKVHSVSMPFKNGYIANMAHLYPDERSTNNSIRVAAELCKELGIDATFVPSGFSSAGLIGFKHSKK